MSFAPREHRFEPPRRAVPAAVALLLALLAPAGQAPAAPVAPAEAIDAAPHGCKCHTRCRGASCCCGPHEPTSRPPAPASSGRADANPCVNAAPCGDPVLPGAPSGGPDGKGAALQLLANPRFDAVGVLLPSPAHRLLPPRRAPRLDEPPERLILA